MFFLQVEPFSGVSRTDEPPRLQLSTWMDSGKTAATCQVDNDNMSESRQRLIMDGNTNSVTGVGVDGDVCEEEEEDARIFVSTLDVDAIKVLIDKVLHNKRNSSKICPLCSLDLLKLIIYLTFCSVLRALLLCKYHRITLRHLCHLRLP